MRQGNLRKKTNAEERNETIEHECAAKAETDKSENDKMDIAKVRNTLAAFDDVKATSEKLKGRFDLRIN